MLRSDAGDFPIVAGVLRLLSDRLQAPIVDLVQQGRQEAALQAALAEKTGSERWTTWQTYRFSMPTFLPVYPLAHLAKGCKTILDFGCGLGHSAFLMKRLAGDALIVCVDYSFSSLYLASRFLMPNAPCICLDGDTPWSARSRIASFFPESGAAISSRSTVRKSSLCVTSTGRNFVSWSGGSWFWTCRSLISNTSVCFRMVA